MMMFNNGMKSVAYCFKNYSLCSEATIESECHHVPFISLIITRPRVETAQNRKKDRFCLEAAETAQEYKLNETIDITIAED